LGFGDCIFNLGFQGELHFGVSLLEVVKLLGKSLSDGFVFGLELLVFLGVCLLHILDSLSSFFLANDRLALTVRNVAQDLFMSCPRLVELLAFLAELKIKELLLLFGYGLIFLPSLAGHLQGLFSRFGLLLKLSDSLASSSGLLLLIGP
jgi:hypothetical protein